MRISAGGMNFLLPGDASSNAEKAILAAGEPLESQVLKVAYYRANSSPSRDFLARVAPRVAIIGSEGQDARAGRSAESWKCLTVLQNAGARIFRTDTDGATTVEWKEGSLVVQTYKGIKTEVMMGEDWRQVSH